MRKPRHFEVFSRISHVVAGHTAGSPPLSVNTGYTYIVCEMSSGTASHCLAIPHMYSGRELLITTICSSESFDSVITVQHCSYFIYF